jgi:uncharacterized membrane protein YbhN (UPF0104 family)
MRKSPLRATSGCKNLARERPPSPQLPHLKKVVLTILQIAVTLGMLWFVFRDPAKRAEMVHALGHARPLWLLAGIAAYGVVELLSAVRWQWLLRVQKIQLSWARVLLLTIIGVFFNFFIPGGTGGDVVKIFYLLKETPGQRALALLSVLVDRILGLLGLALLAAVLLGTQWTWLTSTPETARYAWPAVIILIFTVGGIHFSWLVTKRGHVHKLPARFPGRDKLAELALAYTLYGRAWRVSLAGIGISIIAHLGHFAVFYCAARAFAHDGARLPTLGELSSIMPIINVLSAMPISLGGLGVREGLFEIFLGQLCGVSAAVAVVISSAGYLFTLAWGLIGGALYLFYRPSEHARLREIQAEVATFEHTVAEEELANEIAGEKKR